MAKQNKKANHLVNETSPYLIQHAYNPVNWYPWGQEALSKSKRENKLIFLSIGYSACHWCQVMEKETFENPSIASFLNKHFVSIKVDREERPDIDRVYMSAVQIMTGRGGWPLNVFLTPQIVPVFGGSYFPPEDRGESPGFKKIIESLYTLYSEQKEVLLKDSIKILAAIESTEQVNSSVDLDERLMSTHFNELKLHFDKDFGGFGNSMKFPPPMHLNTLLVYDKREKSDTALFMVTKTLNAMARGGIMDQLGGGFHRYSIDREWKIPHFEKMLTDQALLSDTYMLAYRKSKTKNENSFFLKTAEKTLAYVMREMMSPGGGVYASQDADVDGKEGLYYTWTTAELQKSIGDNIDFEIFCSRFGVTPKGDFENDNNPGKNVLFINQTKEAIAKQFRIAEKTVLLSLEKSTRKVLEKRAKRYKLRTDNKIITSYNGLIISSFSKAYMITGNKKYLTAAQKCADFILKHSLKGNILYRRASVSNDKIEGYLDDYAYFVEGLLNLFQALGKWDYFYKALQLHERMEELFMDTDNGGFFYNPFSGQEPPLITSKFAYDESLPSPNALAMNNCQIIYSITGIPKYKKNIKHSLDYFSEQINKSPSSCSRMMEFLDYYWKGETQIVVLNPPGDALSTILKQLFSFYFPHLSVYLVSKKESKSERWKKIMLSAGKFDMGGRNGTFYLCTQKTCYPPESGIKKIIKTLSDISL